MWGLRFDQTIGSGAFGTVYLAELKSDQGLRRPVAVKMIVQGHADSEMFLTRMRDEARLLGMLRDPQVLLVLDLIRIEDRDAIVMEYVNGADLEVVLEKRHSLSPQAVVTIGRIIAGTLDRAHRAVHPKDGSPLDVVHRDIKPANIMLTTSGDLKLLDFGVARARFAARESSTGQLVLGTLNYMAPDYIITGEVRPALDVYGLALTLWELATGDVYGQPKVRQDSHEDRLESNLDLLPTEFGPIRPILRDMLSWEPEDRPSAGEVALALAQVEDQMTGESLAELAARTIPPILSDRPETEDTEGLLGRRFRIGPPPGAALEDDKAEHTTPIDSSEFDEPTVRSAPPKRHTPEAEPTQDDVKMLTRHLHSSNSVTLNTAAEPPALPPPSPPSRTAVLGGVLIGSLVGLLVVAGIAKLLLG